MIIENKEQDKIIKDFIKNIDDIRKRTISRLHTKMESNSSKKPSIYKTTESQGSRHVSNFEMKEKEEVKVLSLINKGMFRMKKN